MPRSFVSTNTSKPIIVSNTRNARIAGRRPDPRAEAACAELGGAWNTRIVVGTHHKTGAVLLAKVFRQAAKIMGVGRTKSNRTLSALCTEQLAHASPGVCIIEHITAKDVQSWPVRLSSGGASTSWPPFVHAVRDPLEMCVSAYQYHLLGAEPWLPHPIVAPPLV